MESKVQIVMLMKNKLFQRTRRWFMSCQVL